MLNHHVSSAVLVSPPIHHFALRPVGLYYFLNIPKYSLGAYSILNQLVFLSKWAAAPTYGVLLSIIRGIIQTRKSHPVCYHHH